MTMASALASNPLRRRLSLRSTEDQASSKVAPKEKETGIGTKVKLGLWTDLPNWRQHGNELIHTGHRMASGSIKDCLHSWTYIHNETVNIYSHIIGAIIFFAMPLWVFTTEIPPRYAFATLEDIVVCSTWFIGVAICFALSTAFHTFMVHSEAAYLLGLKLDLLGILLLMWGGTVPLVYYSFPCRGTAQVSHWLGITVLAGLSAAATFMPRFNGAHMGPYRAALYSTFGAVSFFMPIAHGMVSNGIMEQSARIGLPWIFMMLVFNGTGAMVYSIKFPEKWFPRKFDLFGASHQIMHIMALSAALAHTKAMLQAFDFLHETGISCMRN